MPALSRLLLEVGARGNRIDVICGTSAGAIEAAAWACMADDTDASAAARYRVWEHLRAEQVYRADSLGLIRSGPQWLAVMSVGLLVARRRCARLEATLGAGHLQALAITALSCTRGEHMTFYQSAVPMQPWLRSPRVAALPRPVRTLLRGVGVSGQGRDARGTALASYLLFEAPFTCELMDLGESDTLARADEVSRFFGWGAARSESVAA